MGENEIRQSMGLSDKDIEKYKEFKPLLKISELDVISVEVISKTPYEITFTDKKTEEKKKIAAIDVKVVGDEFVYALPLSSKTLRLSLFAIFKKHNFKIEGLKLAIKRTVVEYAKWGENNCYRVQEIEE
jgi:hypothetical protein